MTTRMAGPFRIDDPSPDPKAIVLLYGWFGAEMTHVQKYAELWRTRHCNTVAGILNEFAVGGCSGLEVRYFSAASGTAGRAENPKLATSLTSGSPSLFLEKSKSKKLSKLVKDSSSVFEFGFPRAEYGLFSCAVFELCAE